MLSRSIRGRPAARRTVLSAALPCLAASWPGSAATQSGALRDIIDTPAMRDWLANECVTPRPGPPEHFAAVMRAAEEEARTLLRRAGIRIQ